MSMLLAERIFVVTGISSVGLIFSFLRRLDPAMQLWHAVSTITLIAIGLVCDLSEIFLFVESALMTSACTVMIGCGFEQRLIHL